jgi:hypothetical protein
MTARFPRAVLSFAPAGAAQIRAIYFTTAKFRAKTFAADSGVDAHCFDKCKRFYI